MIARVRGVIFFSICVTSMHQVWGSLSTRTGLPPLYVTAIGQELIVNVGISTSTPGVMPYITNANNSFSPSFLNNQHLGCADNIPLKRTMNMALNFAAGRIHDETHLLLKFRWREKFCRCRIDAASDYVGKRFAVVNDMFHMVHR